MTFDRSRAWLERPDWFPRFRVPDRGEPLSRLGLSPDTHLIVAERDGERRAFLLDQLAFHHVAQGRLAGHPYAVSF